MNRTRPILAIILIAMGLVWSAQGAGLLKGSGFMDGDTRWVLIGAAVLVVGIVRALSEIRRRRAA